MSFGGGGQSGETQYNWNPFMENMWGGGINGNPGLLNRATTTLNAPYQSYGGPRQYGFTFDQGAAMTGTRNTALGGTPLANAGREQSRATVEGEYLGANPYAGTDKTIGYNLMTVNPQGNKRFSQVGSNEYAGDNPYFRGVLEQGIGDITDSYNKGISADIRRSANLAGAFGGSAHQQALNDAQSGLGKNISNYVGQMANQQYDRSAGLRESDIGRRLQGSQFDSGVTADNLNRDLQGQMFNSGIGDRNVDRYNNASAQGMQAWENERNRMTGQTAGAMGNDDAAMRMYQSLMGMGNQQQQFGQQGLDLNYNDWTNQQNWERNNLNWMANLLGQAQGSTGVSQTFGGYGGGVNPMAGLLGAASLYGAMR